MRDHLVDLRTITPRQWLAILDAFSPDDTREAIALIAQSRGLQAIIRAAGAK